MYTTTVSNVFVVVFSTSSPHLINKKILLVLKFITYRYFYVILNMKQTNKKYFKKNTIYIYLFLNFKKIYNNKNKQFKKMNSYNAKTKTILNFF